MKKSIFTIILSLITLSLYSNIRLPNIIGSNMVLQQKSTTKIWGWALPAEKIKITTSWDNNTIQTSADGNASWQITLQTPSAGGPYTISFEGENKITLQNIFIGEVWICGGQSNMEWSYRNGVSSIKAEFAQLNKLNLKLFKIPKTTSKTPQDNSEGTWVACDSNVLKDFSAVAYYFGQHLNRDLNTPIGLISSNWGGTPAEVWTPEDLVRNNPVLQEAAAKNNPIPYYPVAPGCAYNAMIAPIVNYKIAGAIWYQGEGNTGTASSYTELMNAMIIGWRMAWNRNFPFYYVQIAPYKYIRNNVAALLREAQTKNLLTEKTGMVVISDLVSDTLNVHPNNKKDVGLRLANLALAETYGMKNIIYKSPLFKSVTIDKNQVVIEFDNAESGLTIKGGAPKELFIAGGDKIFYPANIKLKGNQIFVSSEKVKRPAAVRYQFSNAAIGNLFSKTGLPVGPFRTDSWIMDTSKIIK